MSEVSSAATSWKGVQRASFRFFFLFTLFFSLTTLLPELLWRLPLGSDFGSVWFNAVQTYWLPTVRWVGLDLMGIHPRPYLDDTPAPSMMQLIGLVSITAIALVLTIVWTLADRGGQQHRRLHEGLRVYLRFSLGIVLLSYGVEKVLLNQFHSPPNPTLLMTPLGELNRASLLVAFVGSSPAYQVFAGAVEVIAGVLLMVRRTEFLGALLAVLALTQVVVLNVAFHFTMYVLATSMLVFAAFLALPALRPLAALLLSDRVVPPPPRFTLFTRPGSRKLAALCGLTFLLLDVGFLLRRDLTEGRHWLGQPPLYGAYEVQSFRHSAAYADSATIQGPWRWLTVDALPNGSRTRGSFATIAHPDGTRRYIVQVDTFKHQLTLLSMRRPVQTTSWSYDVPGGSKLNMVSVAPNGLDTVSITLNRRDLGTLPLLRPETFFR